MSMIAAALPLVGGVLDGKTSGVFGKQVRESNKHDKSGCLFGHDVRSVGSFHSHSPIRRRAKGWAQSRLLSVRDKIGSIRLHRGKADLICDADKELTPSRCGDAL